MSGYGRGDYDQQSGYGGNNRREDYGSEGRPSQGEASSYYNSNDDFRSEGRGEGRGDDGYGGRQDGYGSGRQDQQGGYGGGDSMPQGGSYGGGEGYGADDNDDDLSGAARHASHHAGDSGDSNIFSSVLSALGQNKHSIGNQDIDEQGAVQSHQQFFGGGGGLGQASSGTMGSAAAMQALKMFIGGGGSQQGNSQNAFVGMAMAEASKLFDNQLSQGNVQSGASKESAVQQAGEMALKMYLKSQGSGGVGPSGLMGLAGKFL